MEFKNLLKLVNAVSDSKLTGFSYEENGVKIKLKKEQGKVQVVSAAAGGEDPGRAFSVPVPDVKAEEEKSAESDLPNEPEGEVVVSPLVGTFYEAPAEDAEPFVRIGDPVKKGQTLAIVEAMKLMNEIESEYDGVIGEILAENGQLVEYNQPLFRIKQIR